MNQTWKSKTMFLLAFGGPFALGSLALADATAALAYVAPEALEVMADLADAEVDLTFGRRFDASVSVEPSAAYLDFLDDEASGSGDFDLEFGAEFGYSWNDVADLRDRAAVVATRARAELLLRRGVEAALIAHVDVFGARDLAGVREAQVAARALALADAEARAAAGEATALEVEEARLALAEAQVNLQAAQEALERSRAEAQRFGVDAQGPFDPVRFVLPDAVAQATSEHQRLVLQRDLTQAIHDRANVFGTLTNLSVTGTYSTSDIAFRTEAGIIESVPRAEVGVDYPGGRDRWSVGVGAEIVFDTSRRNLPALAERAEEAAADLDAYGPGFVRAFEARLAAVRTAEARLTIDERQVQVALGLVEESEERAAAADAAAASAAAEARAQAERDLQQATRELERRRADAASAIGNLYGSWAAYVRLVGDYLELVEGDWAIRP